MLRLSLDVHANGVSLDFPNQAPQIVAESSEVSEDPATTLQIDLSRYIRDPDLDTLTFTAVSKSTSVVETEIGRDDGILSPSSGAAGRPLSR